jgi:microcystin-dependent protein
LRSSAPVGSVIDLPTTVAPDGYLYCNGNAVSRTTYAGLFAAIGISHGSGDGSTTFNLPDRRGYFPRGVDDGSGRDPDTSSRTAMNPGGNTGDNVGSVQTSQYASHSHPYSGTTGSPSSISHTHNLAAGERTDLTSGGSSGALNDSGTYVTADANDTGLGSHTHGYSGTTTAEGGNESRGINAYTNYFIRY